MSTNSQNAGDFRADVGQYLRNAGLDDSDATIDEILGKKNTSTTDATNIDFISASDNVSTFDAEKQDDFSASESDSTADVKVEVQNKTVDSLSNAANETLAKNFQLDSLDGQRAFVKHCIEENFVSDENFFYLRLYAQNILNLGKRPSRKDENSVYAIAYYATNDIFNMTYAKTIDNFVFNPRSFLLTSDGLKNYIQLCNELKITQNYIIDDVTKNRYFCNFNNSVDVLKVALYLDENFVQKNVRREHAAAQLPVDFDGEPLNFGKEILTPTDEEIKPYYDAVYKMSRGQRAALERQINLLDLRRIFPPDKKGDGFICPLCGNGTGDSGDGIIPVQVDSTDKNGDTYKYVFQHCFSKQDFEGTLTCIISRFNYNRFSPLEYEQRYLYVLAIGKFLLDKASDDKRELPPLRRIADKELDAATLSLIRADIADAQKNIDALPPVERRGLTIDTLKHFGVGFIANWTHPKNRLEEKFFTPTPRLIIPTSRDTYNAILLKSARTDANQQWKSLNAGSKQIFNSAAIVPDEIVVVVEGEIDAMSIFQATGGNVNVIATGGAAQSNIKKFFQAINPIGRLNYKVLILFDADKTGRANSAELTDELKKLGYPATAKFFTDDESKLDANDILTNEGDAALKSRIEQIINAAQIELDACRAELQCQIDTVPIELRISAELKEKIFAGDCSDDSNAERLLLLNADKIKYLTDREKWLTFDGEKWNVGGASNSILYPYARQAMKILQVHADDTKDFKIAAAFKSTTKVDRCIRILKGFDEILITQDDLNRHYNLLNCKNGIVDLETGKLYTRRDAKLLITQMCNAEYHAGRYSSIVDKFFESILPDESTRAALIRYLGYCLTGLTNEEKTLFLRGGGGNGKGTLTKTLLKLFGDYGTAFPIKSLLVQRIDDTAESATPAIAKLVDCRLAICEEIPQNRKLDAAKFKALTGGDAIYYRRLHEDAQIIENTTHKFLVSGNYDIELTDAADFGLIRRWLQIPFNQTFGDKNLDVHLKEKLNNSDALNGLLARLVDAAQLWYKDGLIESDEMKEARLNFFSDQNFIEEFFNVACVLDDAHYITLKDFIEQLRDYTTNICSVSDKSLRDMVKKVLSCKQGVTLAKRDNRIIFKGICWADAYSSDEDNS